MPELTLTVRLTPTGFEAEIFCPAFVDHHSPEDVDDALVWARGRLEGTDPFEAYQE